MIKYVNEKDFEKEISGERVLVDFFATWCGPCKMLGLVMEKFDSKGVIPIVKADIDENVVIPHNGTRSTYTELTLYFWIFTHKQDALYKGRLRNDILNRELKLLFNDNRNIGIAKNHLLYSKVYSSGNYDYMGRHMAFKITDWADEVRYGKK